MTRSKAYSLLAASPPSMKGETVPKRGIGAQVSSSDLLSALSTGHANGLAKERINRQKNGSANGRANGNSTPMTSMPTSVWAWAKDGCESIAQQDEQSDLLHGDPVVVSGMACRLPGGVKSAHDFWNMLIRQRSGQCRVPKERFNVDGFYHPDGDIAGTMNTSGGYFLQEDVRQFENSFFGINNVEATYMDPQQRKLLEVVFECFESSGLTLDDVAGSNTGVYVGNFTVDYQTMQTRDPEHLHRYSATGSGTAILANRISHVFDLRGPSFALDTACSASIYCLHNAVNAILNDECDAAIVAGANLIMSPEQHLGTMKGGVLSPDSTCHTFDARANGYGRGEAVSAVYLQRVSSAISHRDPIRGVVRATAINANGRTPGITQPRIIGQQEVIEKAYRKAGLDIAETDYVEAHGTGTQVGDPMEIEALSRVFSKIDRPPLLIGANKPNLGHSEAASGISALIKCILAFEHDLIPATIGIQKLNPRLKLEEWNMEIVMKPSKWPSLIHRASVNSFGYGGANAHAILESFKKTAQDYDLPFLSKHMPDTQKEFIFPVSGSTSEALKSRVDDIGQRLREGQECDYDNLCYTLSRRRTRLAKPGYVLSRPSTGPLDFTAKSIIEPKETYQYLPLAFAFTGQGAQWPQMGKELLEDSAVFSQAIDDLDDVLLTLDNAPTWTLRSALLEPANSSSVALASHSQPLCTAVQIGLLKMLDAWGVSPSSVVGHSSGEIAAAYAAGLLSEAQAITIAYYRGYAVSQIATNGTMLAAGMHVDEAHELISKLGLQNSVVVACVNSPESVTISGVQEGVMEIEAELKAQNKFARIVQTGGRAYHSPFMAEVGELYEHLMMNALARLPKPRSLQDGEHTPRFFSSAGKHGDELKIFDCKNTHYLKPWYWRQNLENPVQFQQAVTNLLQSGPCHMVEIGPHPAMSGPVKAIRASLKSKGAPTAYFSTLSRNKSAEKCMKALAGELFFAGYDIDFLAVNMIPYNLASLSVLHDLPPYHWTYDNLLWSECRSSVEMRNRSVVRHELLGAPVIAGNGIDFVWRNQLRLDEVPWLGDHKLESQIVFPAAGYLTMVIEAMTQLKASEFFGGARWNVTFREVSIAAALTVSQKDAGLELFTTLAPTRISRSTASQKWYDFTISAVKGEQRTSHCTGSVCIHKKSSPVNASATVDDSDYEQWKMGAWYEKLAYEGLEFGTHFQSLTSLRTDKSRISPNAVSTTALVQRAERPGSKRASTIYGIHPLVIDACLQAAIMGSTAGALSTLKAHLPVFFGKLEVQLPVKDQVEREARIHTISRKTGFTSKVVAATLMSHDNEVLIDMANVRLSEYTGKADIEKSETRHPCLRVVWKPDITRVDAQNAASLEHYVRDFLVARPELEDRLLVGRVGAILDLVAHKNARSRILEMGSCFNSKTEEWLEMLGSGTEFSTVKRWALGSFDEAGELQLAAEHKHGVFDKASENDQFDVVLVVNDSATRGKANYKAILDVLSPRGIIISKPSTVPQTALQGYECQILSLSIGLTLISHSPAHRDLKGQDIVIIKPVDSRQGEQLEQSLIAASSHIPELNSAKSYTLSELREGDVSESSIVVSLLEVDHEFLASMTQESMDCLRRVTDTTRDIIWLTGASTMDGSNPDVTLGNGLSRALMLEQPATRFVVLDIGSLDSLSTDEKASMVHTIGKVLITNDNPDDKEFVLKNGILHVSRFIADTALNTVFEQCLKCTPKDTALCEASPARLAIRKIGMMDSIYFQQESYSTDAVQPGCIEVDVKAVSLNAKDIYVLSGKVETQKGTTAIEFSGIVRRVASDVSDFAAGDRVVVLAPNNFRTTETVPAWAAQKMLPEESFEVMPTLPVIYGTALYALDDRANIRSGESILVHSGAGSFGYATLAIAVMRGAIPYATVGSESKRAFLVESLGIPPENIFNSRDESFANDVLAATKGRGVDVVVNSLTGDLLHASWRCCAAFGRFVEVGKRDLVDAGKLDMSMFLKNVTFTAFDLTELYYHADSHYRRIWTTKFGEALDLYRRKLIQAVPIRTFDVSEISQAYRFFNNRNRVGKVVVSLQNPTSIVKAVPVRYSSRLDPDKSYLLVGCLGGLGRSLSKWMFDRGARYFSFLGRSGADKPAAANLVSSLQKEGASVTVVRGDIAHLNSVEKLVASAKKPIGGVIHAAMGLHEALFSKMTCDAWQTGIQPKWRGAWNLHHTLQGNDKELDFFLMTSSVSGSVGTATESNYCAANGFLDAFARYRRSLGKPAISVGLGMISEVGYLHENPEIEALLLRKGIQPLNEEEFLQVLDLALSSQGGAKGMDYDSLAASHILTGLEAQGIKKMMAMGFDVNNGTMKDPRAAQLSAALDQDNGDAEMVAATVDATWSKGLPPHILKSLAPVSAQSASLGEAVQNLVCRSFSNLLLIPREKVDPQQSVSSVGMDSMIASEFRSWFFGAFQVDIPFLDIMDPGTTLSSLSRTVETKLTIG